MNHRIMGHILNMYLEVLVKFVLESILVSLYFNDAEYLCGQMTCFYVCVLYVL